MVGSHETLGGPLQGIPRTLAVLIAALCLAGHAEAQANQCLSNDTLNELYATDNPTCCQNDVCNIPCPQPFEKPGRGYGMAIIVAIAISFTIGIATTFLVHGKAENFFVAGRSLPLWIAVFTLGAQSIESNSILGNADLSYKYGFYDGAVLPIGVGLSLILNALFLAGPINRERDVLTLPDILAKRYGKVVEILVSLTTILSFLILLAGQLVGLGAILEYLWGITSHTAVWTAAAIIWAYTASGGLFSVAYTDVFQGALGWSGCIVCTSYIIFTSETKAPPPSIGFPGYMYPDTIGDGGVCDMYEGVPCNSDASACCYNEALWCPSSEECRADNGAYPFGDTNHFRDQLVNPLAMSPFPNALFFNWATLLILAFGNLAALDFQARCLASKTPKTAVWGCFIGGILTFIVGVPFSFLGGIERVHYGPDSVYAEFVADTCSEILGLPTCAEWKPHATPLLNLLTQKVPGVIGAWCLFGIVAASMSTADGAILAMGTVFSHNIVRHIGDNMPNHLFEVTDQNLLKMARLGTIPFAVGAAALGAYYKSAHPSGATGYLLIVAFDVTFATVVVPLFGCFYAKTPRPNSAFLSILVGATLRIVLEFSIPKDGYLVLPFDEPEFLNYGPASSSKLPTFLDTPSPDDAVEDYIWQSDKETCNQNRYEDYTGADSLGSALASLLVFVLVQFVEEKLGRPLFNLPGLQPYEKHLGSSTGKPNEKSAELSGYDGNRDILEETERVNNGIVSDSHDGGSNDSAPTEPASAQTTDRAYPDTA